MHNNIVVAMSRPGPLLCTKSMDPVNLLSGLSSAVPTMDQETYIYTELTGFREDIIQALKLILTI
jgi:hypothetical protein